MAVVGGRALGLEFAEMYSHFGTKVTVLQRSERILPESEPEISRSLKNYLEEDGIRIITSMRINHVQKKRKNKVLNISASGKNFNIECEQILFATGRKPNTDFLGLEKSGVKTDEEGFIIVNNEMQTSVSHIWAGGDVIGEPMLVTIAAKEGAVAVENAFTENKKKINFNEVPSAVFTYPEVASVGLTDAEANQKGIKCTCRTLPLEFVPKAHVVGDTRGLVKIIAENNTKKIIGVYTVQSPLAFCNIAIPKAN